MNSTVIFNASAGNRIHDSIQLTGDAASMHENSRLPTLDLAIWSEERTQEDDNKASVILHEFYAKDVSAKMVTHARSAMPSSMKRTVLTQEVLRVILRCSPLLEWNRVAEHVSGMMKRLQFSGYGQAYRADILNAALNAYDVICEKDHAGVEPRYRPKDWKREEREVKKRQRKESWFRDGGAETVIFVPNTPHSELKRRYVNEIRKAGLRVNVVEGVGKSIKSMLQRSDPFKSSDCVAPYADTCPVCMAGNKGCRRDGVTYEITCNSCDFIYVGETADNAFTRGRQHADALKNKSKDSVLHKHVRSIHRHDPPPIFNMNVTGTYGNDALLRQVAEARAINKNSSRVMNSRAEWNHQSIPRVIIADD